MSMPGPPPQGRYASGRRAHSPVQLRIGTSRDDCCRRGGWPSWLGIPLVVVFGPDWPLSAASPSRESVSPRGGQVRYELASVATGCFGGEFVPSSPQAEAGARRAAQAASLVSAWSRSHPHGHRGQQTAVGSVLLRIAPLGCSTRVRVAKLVLRVGIPYG